MDEQAPSETPAIGSIMRARTANPWLWQTWGYADGRAGKPRQATATIPEPYRGAYELGYQHGQEAAGE